MLEVGDSMLLSRYYVDVAYTRQKDFGPRSIFRLV